MHQSNALLKKTYVTLTESDLDLQEGASLSI